MRWKGSFLLAWGSKSHGSHENQLNKMVIWDVPPVVGSCLSGKTHHSCIELCEEHYPVPNLLTDLLTNCWTCMNMSPIISIFSNDGELARYLSMMCCWSYDHLITLMHGNCYLPVNQIRTPLQQKHIPYIAGSETFITPILIVHQWFPFTIPNPHVFIGNKHPGGTNLGVWAYVLHPDPK